MANIDNLPPGVCLKYSSKALEPYLDTSRVPDSKKKVVVEGVEPYLVVSPKACKVLEQIDRGLFRPESVFSKSISELAKSPSLVAENISVRVQKASFAVFAKQVEHYASKSAPGFQKNLMADSNPLDRREISQRAKSLEAAIERFETAAQVYLKHTPDAKQETETRRAKLKEKVSDFIDWAEDKGVAISAALSDYGSTGWNPF